VHDIQTTPLWPQVIITSVLFRNTTTKENKDVLMQQDYNHTDETFVNIQISTVFAD